MPDCVALAACTHSAGPLDNHIVGHLGKIAFIVEAIQGTGNSLPQPLVCFFPLAGGFQKLYTKLDHVLGNTLGVASATHYVCIYMYLNGR